MAPVLRLIFEKFYERSPGIIPPPGACGCYSGGACSTCLVFAGSNCQFNYRNEPSFWAEIGNLLGHGKGVIGLTQDYGYRLAYWGWQGSTAWFTSADINLRYLAGQNIDLGEKFAQDTAGKQYFLVTMFGEFDDQPVIKDLLSSHYPVFAQTDEYIIYDLQHPLSPTLRSIKDSHGK